MPPATRAVAAPRHADDDPRLLVPFPGRKSGNCLLHWMEALTELVADTGDAGARVSLREAVDRCRDPLYPADPAATLEPCLPHSPVRPD